jgi:hypothetical protein
MSSRHGEPTWSEKKRLIRAAGIERFREVQLLELAAPS